MLKSLCVVFAVWIYAVASPTNRGNLDAEIRGLLSSSLNHSKMPEFQLTTNLSNSDLVSLVNDIIQSLSQNGSLTEEGSLRLKDMLGHYWRRRGEIFTVDRIRTDKDTGMDALKDFLQKLKLKNGNFEYTIVRSLNNEIDIEEEEEETNDLKAKDQIIVDYIKNIDKTIAVEEGDPEAEPNDKQLKRLFNIMTL